MKQRFYLFTAIAASLVLFTACQSEIRRGEVEDARKYFENTAVSLSLPLYNVPATKAQDIAKYTQSVTPLWEEAVVTEIGGRKIIEIPLAGPVKLVGVILTRQRGIEERTLAATKSYLVMDYAGGEPEMYVETFLQRGKECTMLLSTTRSEITGIQIKSDLNGTIFEQIGYDAKGAHEIEVCEEHHHHGEMHDTEGFDSIGYSILYNVLSTKVGCPIYGEFCCPVCGQSYSAEGMTFADIYCPYCGTWYDRVRDYCAICGQSYEKCTCGSQPCNPCGHPKWSCGDECSKSPSCPCGH